MLRVAFCDDQIEILTELSSLIEKYRLEKNLEVEFSAFQSPIELLARVEKGVNYDILFLDILMGVENGIQVAKELRDYDSNVKIIFLTSTPEYAVQSYQVKATFYQLKPIRKDAFYRIMDQIVSEQLQEQCDYLIVKCKTGITRIKIAQLEYCEVINRSMFFHLSNGKELESADRIEDIEDRLKEFKRFIRPHRSYLINMDYIQIISTRCITMESLTSIPIPHGKCTQVKDRYLEYLCK